jgi:hypothetical protein
MKLRTTDLERLLAARPVNRQSAVVTAGGTPRDDRCTPEPAPAPASQPSPEPSPRAHDPIGTRRVALTRELRALNVRLSNSKDPAIRRSHAKRIGALQRELNTLPDQGDAWSTLLLRVARDRLDGESWAAIEREARQRLAQELRR